VGWDNRYHHNQIRTESDHMENAKSQFGLREKNKRDRKDARTAGRRAKQVIAAREAAAFQRLLDGQKHA
jgi:hypothetical protein